MMNDFPENWAELDVVLCHDWLTGMRGGERVLEILCRGFPDAVIVTLVHNRRAISDIINAHDIRTSWLQHIPGITKNYRRFLPLFPSTIEAMSIPSADLVISTSHCVAKGVRPEQGTPHICYCFTPMRYAWTFHKEYLGDNPLKLMLAKPVLSLLRRWDRKVCNRVDRFVAISQHVQRRISDFYDREADIVFPPVDTDRLRPAKDAHGDFDLIVSALVPYKRVDLAIDACTRLGYPLKIVGVGGEMAKLKKTAGSNVEFLGWQSDNTILGLYQNCRMLIFPGEEDFGIVPLEAQACGRPVVAFGRGGALETVAAGVSGVFFNEQTEDALIEAVSTCAATNWNGPAIRSHAETFATHNFISGLSKTINKVLCRIPTT